MSMSSIIRVFGAQCGFLAPPEKYGNRAITEAETNIRWAGFALLMAAAIAEASWILVDRRKRS
ncbi:hypothetical protein GCM10010384_10270 [Streptomyces djakartensis]|uniref:Uncharacterized protein n=1 Tax=Streptomyces djakartensis TaxID=68193 RepID=A0ABQ2Z9D5_9ACTN|nr:hypothetical protein GCM10010384_10270 [Streptomyces djakartensis]